MPIFPFLAPPLLCFSQFGHPLFFFLLLLFIAFSFVCVFIRSFRPSWSDVMCWIWFSCNVRRIDIRHWLLILAYDELTSQFRIDVRFVFFLSISILASSTTGSRIKVNKVSFLLAFPTTRTNNSFRFYVCNIPVAQSSVYTLWTYSTSMVNYE